MRRRIVIFYLVLAVVVSTLVASFTYQYSSRMYLDQIEKGLVNETVLIGKILMDTEEITDEALKGISDTMISHEYESSLRRISLINGNGVVLADSGGNSIGMENHLDRLEVATALQGKIGVDVRRSKTTGLDLIYVARYFEDLDAVIRISTSVSYLNNIRRTILAYYTSAVILSMVISALIALVLSGYVVKPIARLVKEYGGAAKSESRKKTDEVKQLSSTLSSMALYIENVIKELQDRNNRVNTIINSMNNGIIAVDTSMQILLINPVVRRLFGVEDHQEATGVPLVQVIHNRKINDLMMRAIVTNRVANDEIILNQDGKRIISVHVSPISPMGKNMPNSGALAFLNDVTQIRKLEEIRSGFVANVTHELKTPLTSIQGFVETLKSGAINDPQVSEKFLDIIEIEADRLHNLIDDILQLSEIEGINRDKEIQVFKLLPLVQEVESILRNAAEDKDIRVEIDVREDIALRASYYRVKQLLINLMDNAIKYNKPGGWVKVSAFKKDNQIELHVMDTGIGIPAEHRPRIFERFYRVDKSRSRELGGTGLGLSIVKHIANLYNGSVRVESLEGEGSDFIVTFPDPLRACS